MTAELDALFAAPLKTFVAERKRLVAELKAAGKPKEAKELGQTPRPSVSAWIVNQLARQEAPLLAGFVAITDRLQGAQGRGASPGRADDTAEALAAHRDALKRLRARAEEILIASGQAARPQILERVVRNLRVGIASGETRRTIVSGRLIQDVAAGDFVSLLGEAPEVAEDATPTKAKGMRDGSSPPGRPGIASAAPHAAPPRPRVDVDRQAVARAADEAKARARAQAERSRERIEADARIRTLRAKAEGARRTLERSERSVETARQTLIEAEAALAQARLDAERAAQELKSAESALDALP